MQKLALELKTAGIFAVTFFLGYCAAQYLVDTAGLRQELLDVLRGATESVSGTSDTSSRLMDVPDEVKIAITAAWLQDISPKDHAVNDRGELYLEIPDAIFGGLPHKVNGVTIKQLRGEVLRNNFQSAYISLKGWKATDNRVSVVSTARFSASNTSGCTFVYAGVDGKWVEQSRRCFATAS